MQVAVELPRMSQQFAMLAPIALGVFAMTGAIAASSEDVTYVKYTGTATAARTDQFLYQENHVLEYRDGNMAGRVVLYTCRDGSAFARKTTSYANPLSPDFLLEDASNGMREGIRTEGNMREVFFRGDRSTKEKVSNVPQVDGLVADSGFDEFVRTHWQALLAGRSLQMNFLVPSRLQDMSFKVQRLRSETLDGRPVEVFRLNLSGVLGWIAPSIDVYYGSNRNLIRYVGLSDLRNATHDNFNARIEFRPEERKSSDEQSMKNALKAHLAPCR